MSHDREPLSAADTAAWGAECERLALEALRAGEWRGVYEWTKSWIARGGGAWLPDTWLLYAASSLLQGQPRGAVHSLDLGLRHWLDGSADRAALTWVRGTVVRYRLSDPRTALLDLESDLPFPVWVVAGTLGVDEEIRACREEAGRSRKRKATVSVRPDHRGPGTAADVVAPAVVRRLDGDEPRVWAAVAQLLMS